MLNRLNHSQGCEIVTTGGDRISGIFFGVETVHGDWAILVSQNTDTLSIPLHQIEEALPTA